ncbi:MAG: polyferredoxin/YHS domain-containing protein [Candidatus Latescibacterota bacterium]|jgi:polyferredoxin/YHS domain-containing protein
MKGRVALFFPYVCALLVIATLVWRNWDTSFAVHKDPVCNMEVGENLVGYWQGKSHFFCTEHCRELFQKDPGTYLVLAGTTPGTHIMLGLPNWLYYGSVGLILVLSFGIFEKKRYNTSASGTRFDLLQFRGLRQLIIHPFTRFGVQAFAAGLFVLIIAAGLFGNQLSTKNIAPLVTWTIWWGGLILLILYAGKAWCYVCPWDAIAGWAEGLRFWGRKGEGLSLGIRWPKFMRNVWPATLFFVGLTWIEIGFGVTMKPRMTAWLALGMLAMAFVSAFIFDRKSFCRYGCLVGRVSGLYAMFSPIEVRARDKDVCRSCETHSCYKGNDQGDPCPTFQYLGTMDRSTYCISCMECVKSCELENVALNLRPWGEDLSQTFRPRNDEAYLALVLLSLTGFHGLTMTGLWQEMLDLIQLTLSVGETFAFTIGMFGLMVAPVVAYAGLVGISWLGGGSQSVAYRDYFIRYAYALLPIALFYHLAHNSEHLLMEGQKVVALLSDPFGWSWDLFGTATWTLPPLIDLPTLWAVQVFLVVIGHIYSLWIARHTALAFFSDSKAALRSQLPMLVAMILFSTISLWLLKQPMEMRTSAM